MKQWMKKFVAVVVTAAMVCSVGMPVFAAEEEEVVSPAKTMTAYLENEEGTIIPIEGTLVNTPLALADGEYSATYEYLVPRASFTSEANDYDSSYSVQSFLTIKYSTNSNTPTEYLLTGVSGYWKLLDTNVSVTKASLTYGCSGTFPVPVTQNKTVAVSNNFNYSTGFSKYVADPYAAVGANLTLGLKHGTSTWNFKLVNNIVG